MSTIRQAGDEEALRRIARMAAIAAAVVALSFPSVYFLAAYTFLSGSMEKEAQVDAYMLSQRIGHSPQMWRYESYRLTEMFENMIGRDAEGARRVFDSANRLVVQHGEDVPPPSLTVKEKIFESGRDAGRIEISQSLRGIIARTGFFALLGALLGVLIHAGFRLLPLRLLNRAWEDLTRSRMFVQSILDNAADAIISLDESLRIVRFNKPAEEMFGYSEAAAAGRPIGMLLPQESPAIFGADPAQALAKEYALRGTGERIESVGRSEDGKGFPVEVSFSSYLTDGKLTFTVMIRDITARKRLEVERQLYIKRLRDALEKLQKSQEMIVRAEKLSSLGTLAAGAAHEILNPANIIGLHAQRMQWENPDESPARKTADVIVRNVARITRICENLRRFSRDNPVHIEPVNLDKVVADSLEAFSHEFRLLSIQAEVELGGENHLVKGDRNQLQQVLVNIIKNAVDAMPGGGRLSVGLREVPEDQDRWWEIRVGDTGKGIPPDVLARIFDPFFTTKPEDKGTGLGLSVSHGIIESHGGKIWAESDPGGGAAFFIRLPALAGEPTNNKDRNAA